MTDANPSPDNPEPEVVDPASERDEEASAGSVSEPAKVMRIGSMIRLLLEEVRQTELDEPGRKRLQEIYESSLGQLSEAISPDLQEELLQLASPFADDGVPTESELRLAQAQLVGWLEGLFQGIQATLFAQQMAARQQLEQMKQQGGLPPGIGGGASGGGPQPGVYL